MNQSFYADSSVLVKLYINEAGSSWIRSLIDPSQNSSLFTTSLSIIEVLSAFNRRIRETLLSKTDYDLIKDEFLLTGNNYNFIKLESAISGSQRLLEKYPLRAGDAIQLASAVIVRTSMLNAGLQEPIFLASDNKLLDSAVAEGFATDNPLLHP